MLYSIQIGRGLAALLVVLYHISGTIALEKYFNIKFIESIFSFGYIGVEFFFVLSGFIIYLIHEKDFSQPKRLLAYLKKRLIRIYPIYLIIFIFIFVVAYFSPLKDTLPSDLHIIIKSLLLIPQDKQIVGGTGAPVLIVAWSLQYEIVFYILFALLIINKNIVYILIPMYLVALFSNYDLFIINFLINEYFLLFLMGMAVAYLSKREFSKKIATIIFTSTLISLLTIIILKQMKLFTFEYQISLFGLIFSLLILSVVNLEKKGLNLKKYSNFTLLGDISYSLYLIHFPLISILLKILFFLGIGNYGFNGAIIAFLIITIVTIFSSILIHKLIEKPLTNYLNRKFI